MYFTCNVSKEEQLLNITLIKTSVYIDHWNLQVKTLCSLNKVNVNISMLTIVPKKVPRDFLICTDFLGHFYSHDECFIWKQ